MAARRAVAETLAAVHDFVHGDAVPKSWVPVQVVQPSGVSHRPPLVTDAHPFIGVRQELSVDHVRHCLIFRMHLPPVLPGC